MTKRVALYLRVSTADQTTDNQKRELLAAAKRHKWNVIHVFRDAGISGAKGRADRRGFDQLHQVIARKGVDLVAAWSVDRIGRSVSDLVAFLGELHSKSVGLYLHQQGLDTTTPAGKAMFQMMGVFSEFEREMTSERIKAGLARTKKRIGRPRTLPLIEAKVAELLRAGQGIRNTAKFCGVGISTVQRIKKDLASTPSIEGKRSQGVPHKH